MACHGMVTNDLALSLSALAFGCVFAWHVLRVGEVMALSEEKILKIIEKEQHITVKRNNKPLLKRLEQMEDAGKIEWKDSFKDCLYYGKPGVRWKLNEF